MYISPDIQNEIIKLMGVLVLRDVSADLQDSPFLTVMADSMTDSSNQKQVTLILCQFTQDVQVHEEFLGLYHVASLMLLYLLQPSNISSSG